MSPNGGGSTRDTREYVRPSDVVEELNFIERMRDEMSSGDEYLEALLTNQRLLALQLLNKMQMGGLESMPISAIETNSAGVPTNYTVDVRVVPPEEILNSTNLPLAAVGKAAEDIRENDIGKAVFQRRGTVFNTTVRATEHIAGGNNVRVISPGNIVENLGDGQLSLPGFGDPAGTFAYRGRTYAVPKVTDVGQHIRVANQTYTNGTRQDVDSDLDPGEDKVFARIQVPRDQLLLVKHTNATSHDTTRYDYYIDGTQERDEDLSGTVPWATPPDLYEFNEDGYMFVEELIELHIVETSGSNAYTDVQGTLTAIAVEV
jgi:hypothetical protein